jgi:hypothetical protein
MGLWLGLPPGSSVGGVSGTESGAKRFADGGGLGLVECNLGMST